MNAKIIAHSVKNLKEARDALKSGVDFLEIDVAKRIFFNKFIAQHNGLLGIAGIGPMLEKILIAEVKTRAFLDLKPVSFRNSFTSKLSQLILRVGLKNAKICGHDWKLISDLCEKSGARAYYTLKNKGSIHKIKKMVKELKKPYGFSVRHGLINKSLVRYLKSDYPLSEIWAWTVNDVREAKRLLGLGVDGIITDDYQKLLKGLSVFRPSWDTS